MSRMLKGIRRVRSDKYETLKNSSLNANKGRGCSISRAPSTLVYYPRLPLLLLSRLP